MAESCFFVDIKKRVPYTDNKECLYKGGKGYELCRNIIGTGNRSDVCGNSGRILYYVAFSWSHMKALKALGYDKAWLAWIPFGVLFACSDAVTGDADQVRMFNSFEVPAAVFKFWWIAQLALWVLSLSGPLATLINLALNITFYGCTYAKMYALLERKAEEETR